MKLWAATNVATLRLPAVSIRKPGVHHSYLSATTGSTFDARRAGT
jgi:hypothetical protein